ncbi:DUF218 domain-containing protein [Mycena polygramma]|nr:DUF218 domain-containing protein [Mycena polygramma]
MSPGSPSQSAKQNLAHASPSTEIDADAAVVYNYHRMGMPLLHCDAIFTLCSLDLRVAAHAAQLYLDGYGDLLIFSGGSSSMTAGCFPGFTSEAAAFAAVARSMGVPDSALLLEEHSTNTGENVRLTHALLMSRGGESTMPRSFLLVQKPYMERRTWATFAAQWPGGGNGGEGSSSATFRVTSPPLEWLDYPDTGNPRALVINLMVGDLVRIRDYPARGFQVAQDIPNEVWLAAERLIAAGYDAHLPRI